jgi:hypothetical protein
MHMRMFASACNMRMGVQYLELVLDLSRPYTGLLFPRLVPATCLFQDRLQVGTAFSLVVLSTFKATPRLLIVPCMRESYRTSSAAKILCDLTNAATFPSVLDVLYCA